MARPAREALRTLVIDASIVDAFWNAPIFDLAGQPAAKVSFGASG